MAKIFISYSHQDERWKNRVVKHLKVLAGEGLEVWDDRSIAAGADWEPEITQAIADCDVAVLLISADFLTSRFILGKEVPPLLQRRQDQGIRVIPLILAPCAWDRIGWLRPIQARPKDGNPLTGMKKHDAESALAALVVEIAGLGARLGPAHVPGRPLPPERIDLTHLPAGAENFLGRGPELAALDAAWTQPGIAVVELIASGGTGKTALAKRWLDGLRAPGWGGATQVYGWSFYSQGTGEDRQASEDHFLADAIKWFGVDIEASTNPADKGRALADCIAASRTLLVLDGLEPLQYPPGPMAGELRAPGLKTLLTQLASAGQPGLCILTSREWLQDLSEWVRKDTNPNGAVLRLDLGNLNDADGAALLHAGGATKAGAAAIGPEDEELQQASQEVHGHALTLSLLGRYLARTKGGDIRQRDVVELTRADRDARGHAAKVVAAYETWFAREGEQRSRELAALRLLGFFDRPASRELLNALREAPPIAGLTEALQGMDEDAWRATLANLADCGLAQPDAQSGSLDAHPLVREHLAATLQRTRPEAWREGHRRLYEWLKASAPHQPEGLAGLQPLYQAVAHGCLAGLWQEACDAVYVDRILRGKHESHGFYSWKKLGAFGANLGALAYFFAEPWRCVVTDLGASEQAWLLNETAIQLRALGRLAEALEPMRSGVQRAIEHSDWKNAAKRFGNLSELRLSLGQIPEAVAHALGAVEHADRSGDIFERCVSRATLANALRQQGETGQALATFAQAEGIQAEWHPHEPFLYSFRGFLYCDLLLAEVERAVWAGASEFVACTVASENQVISLLVICEEVALRAGKALGIAERCVGRGLGLHDLALDHLTLARSALYNDRLPRRPPGPEARDHTKRALGHLHAASTQHHLPLGLLTRAWLRHALNDPDAARADLDEAERIASRGAMALHLADIALTCARLFHDRPALARGRALIEKHAYGRRLPELQDAEAAAATWPA